jgi:hypothetical protein
MVGMAIFAVVLAVLVVGPLAVRAWHERMSDRGLAIRADIDAVLRHELHGESLLGVQVVPEAPWRPGRVEVSVPEGWDPVLADVSEPMGQPGDRVARARQKISQPRRLDRCSDGVSAWHAV